MNPFNTLFCLFKPINESKKKLYEAFQHSRPQGLIFSRFFEKLTVAS